MSNYAYITVLSNTAYLPGVYALKVALEKVGSQYELLVLIPQELETELSDKIETIGLKYITAPDVEVPLELLEENSYWNATFFKLRTVGLTQFEKIVLLDSDMLILKNLDNLFECPSISAVVDGAPFLSETHLNSGIMVIEPSKELENRWINQVESTVKQRKEEGLSTGDQDVIRDAEPDWPEREELHLPPQYNVFLRDVDELCEKYLPNGYEDLCVVHFIGPYKPWNYTFRKRLSNVKRLVLPGKTLALRALRKYKVMLRGFYH